MATYTVTGSSKDRDGDITGLCGSWGRSDKVTVIQLIQLGNVFSVTRGGSTSYVRVATRNGKPYLTTNRDGVKPNNLDDLNDC